LNYKNYIGSVEFSAEDNILYGKILGINDLVSYEGTSMQELENAFIETCKELDLEDENFDDEDDEEPRNIFEKFNVDDFDRLIDFEDDEDE